MRLSAMLAALFSAAAIASPANAATFSLQARPQGGQIVWFSISNTLDTDFYIYRDGVLIDHVTGTPIFHFTEANQPLGQHTYQTKANCQFFTTVPTCQDASNLVAITVT